MKGKIKDEQSLLKIFFDPYQGREKIEKPFLSDGYVCATETHNMILINPDILENQYEDNGMHATKAIKPDNVKITIPISRIEQAISECPKEIEYCTVIPEEPCSECNEEGSVLWEYTDSHHHTHREMYECPICNGSGVESPAVRRPTGREVPSWDSNISIRGLIFRAIYIKNLLDAARHIGVDHILYTSSHRNAGNVFRISPDVMVIIMPIENVEAHATIKGLKNAKD